MSRGGRRRFFGPVQGDAAAEVEEDERRGGGGGARALERQRRKMMEEKSNEGLWAGPIYKGRLVSGREKRGGRRHDYLAAETPRFSGWSLR